MSDRGLLDLMRRSGGLAAIAARLEIPPGAVLGIAEVLLPLLSGGLRRRLEAAGDPLVALADLVLLLNGLGGGQLAVRVLDHEAADAPLGDGVVAAILGDGPNCNAVVAEAAQRGEAAPATVAAILPLLALLVAGYIAARAERRDLSELLAELGPMLGLGTGSNPLDDLPGMPDQSRP